MTTDPRSLADELAFAIDLVEQDIADDLAHAETTGERPDLHDYVVEVPLGGARAILDALHQSSPTGEVKFGPKFAHLAPLVEAIEAGEVTQADVEAALKAPVPGGSSVWVWLPQKDGWTPHETAYTVMRCALEAAFARHRQSPAPPCTICGNPNRNHFSHLAPFGDDYHEFAPPAPSGVGELVERLRADLEVIQWGDRPLPWVVHSGCSYRRIASEPTLESGFRTFPDGNVLHALRQQDGHPDLSMGERELEALVRLVNALPGLTDTLAALQSRCDRLGELLDELQAAESAYRYAHDYFGDGASETGRAWDLMRRRSNAARAALEGPAL